MSKDGINQNYKARLRDLPPIRGGNNMSFPTKMVLVAVLLSGLVSLSSYTFIANATTTTITNHVITGDTQNIGYSKDWHLRCNHQKLAW